MPPWNREHFKLKPGLVWRFRLKAAWHRWVSIHANVGVEIRPFIVTGPARSGTSLLTALLTRKPNVLVVNEPVVVSDLTFAEFDVAKLLRGYFNATARRALAKGRLKTKVHPDSPDRPTTDTANQGYARNDVPVQVDAARPLALGVKHPQTFIEYLQEICDGWPELKVICAVREPGPTIRSWRETGFGWDPQLDDKALGIWRRHYDLIPSGVTDPLEKRAHLWRIQVERAHAFATARPEQVLIARYEELVRDPAAALARIFTHVGADAPTEPIDVSDVKVQHRPSYRGFTEAETAMIDRICGDVDALTRVR